MTIFRFLILGLLLALPAAFAQSPQLTLPRLPLAIDNFPPFEYEEGGKVTGFDAEIVELVLQRMGYGADIHVLPWARALAQTQAGEFAAIFSLTKSRQRDALFYFADPISTVQDVFFKRKNLAVTWKTLADLAPYRVGISHGYTYAPEFMAAVQGNAFKEVQVLAGGSMELRQLRKLKSGNIDLLICEVSVCSYLIKTYAPEFDELDFIDQSVGEVRPYHIAFSKKWPESASLVKSFNLELAKLTSEGQKQVILQRYGATHPKR